MPRRRRPKDEADFQRMVRAIAKGLSCDRRELLLKGKSRFGKPLGVRMAVQYRTDDRGRTVAIVRIPETIGAFVSSGSGFYAPADFEEMQAAWDIVCYDEDHPRLRACRAILPPEPGERLLRSLPPGWCLKWVKGRLVATVAPKRGRSPSDAS